MKSEEFIKLCELFGFAPSRALLELLEAVERRAFHDANINAAATILDAAVLKEREACAKVCDDKAKETFSGQCAVWGDYFARAIRARGKE